MTILPSDIIGPSSGADYELIAASLAALMRTSGLYFSDYQRPTDWAKIYQALDTDFRNTPLTRRSGHENAVWTRVPRTLMDPEALMEAGERFDMKIDNITFRREMGRAELVELVKSSMKMREEKEREWIKSRRVGEGGRREQ